MITFFLGSMTYSEGIIAGVSSQQTSQSDLAAGMERKILDGRLGCYGSKAKSGWKI